MCSRNFFSQRNGKLHRYQIQKYNHIYPYTCQPTSKQSKEEKNKDPTRQRIKTRHLINLFFFINVIDVLDELKNLLNDLDHQSWPEKEPQAGQLNGQTDWRVSSSSTFVHRPLF